MTFAAPIAVTAGTTYVASYFSPEGAYTASAFGLASAIDGGPVQTVANSVSSNGVYAYGASSNFPASSYDAANYWVDVMYALPVPGQPTAVSAAASGATSATVNWTAPAGGGPVTSYRITPYVGATAQTAKTVTAPATSGTVTGLTSGTTYTFRVEAINANGAGAASAASNAVTPAAAVAPVGADQRPRRPGDDVRAGDLGRVVERRRQPDHRPDRDAVHRRGRADAGPGRRRRDEHDRDRPDNGTSYTFRVTATNAVGTSPASAASDAVTPQATIFDFADAGDRRLGRHLRRRARRQVPLELRRRGDRHPLLQGRRQHRHARRRRSGTRPARGSRQATFTNESGVRLAVGDVRAARCRSPPDTTYVASYYAPNGHYSVTGSGFSSAVDERPAAPALANATSPNGVYAYGAASSFPQGSFGASNYCVDVLFAPAGVPGVPTGVSATAGQASATVSWTAPASGGPVDLLHGHALHRRDRADPEDDHRHAAGHDARR